MFRIFHISGFAVVVLGTAFASTAMAADGPGSRSIILMEEGEEIFMDKRAPEDRIILMDEGEEV